MKEKCTIKLGDKEIIGSASFCFDSDFYDFDEFLNDLEPKSIVEFTGKFDPPDPFVKLKKGDIVDLKDENGQFIGKAECIKKDENGAKFRMVDK